MGMAIGSSQSGVGQVVIKNRDGSTAGKISIRKASSAKKKTKRLQYNFKEISTQLMMAKTSNGASQVVARARRKVATLLRNRKSGEYDEDAVNNAIIHARRLEQIARKRLKHLKQEEAAEGKGNTLFSDDLEDELEDNLVENTGIEEAAELSEEELAELMEELQQELRETESEMTNEKGVDELTEVVASKDMSEEDLDRLKKKHRSDELREIMEADMKYLKAVFQKLAQEQQNVEAGVSLQLSGVEMPVELTAVPVAAEGANVDALL